MQTFGEFITEAVDYGSASKALRTEIDGAIAFVRAKGIRIPEVKVFNRAGSLSAGVYSASNDCIYIGSRLPKLLAGTTPFHSTSHRYQIFLHEIGHMLHSDAVGDRYDNLKNMDYYRRAMDVTKDVSKYANTNALEFVADVVAGILSGKTYSDVVMQQYAMVDGPKL